MNDRDVFIEGFGNIVVTGHIVRIETLSLEELPTEGQTAPRLAAKHRLIMPIEGFLRSFSGMEQIMKKLIADGVVTPNKQGVPQTRTKPAAPPAGRP